MCPKKTAHASNAQMFNVSPGRWPYQHTKYNLKKKLLKSNWCNYIPNARRATTKDLSIIHVNNWLWKNYCLKEFLDELMVMPEKRVTLDVILIVLSWGTNKVLGESIVFRSFFASRAPIRKFFFPNILFIHNGWYIIYFFKWPYLKVFLKKLKSFLG